MINPYQSVRHKVTEDRNERLRLEVEERFRRRVLKILGDVSQNVPEFLFRIDAGAPIDDDSKELVKIMSSHSVGVIRSSNGTRRPVEVLEATPGVS